MKCHDPMPAEVNPGLSLPRGHLPAPGKPRLDAPGALNLKGIRPVEDMKIDEGPARGEKLSRFFPYAI